MPASSPKLRAVRRLLRAEPFAVAAFVLGVVLAPWPLVGVWGYESSLVCAPVLSILGLMDAVRAVGRVRAAPDAAPWEALATRSVVGPGLTCLALAAGLGTAFLWQRVCDPAGGLALLAMGAGLSCVAGWWTGALCAVATRSRRRAVALAVGAVLASTAVALLRLYRDPAVFAFDPYWGYFAGAIYDEHVEVGPTFVAYRIYNALAIGAGIVLALLLTDPRTLTLRRPRRSRRTVLLSVLFAALAGRTIHLAATADMRGFHASLRTLERALPRTLRTEHFVLHFAPQTATHREIEALAAEHEFAYAEIARRVGAEPKGPIHSFVFPDAGTKRAVMGAGRVEVAPPWRRHLYLHHKPFPQASLLHELAHAFESAIGDPLFGLSLRGGLPNMGLVEGVATAMADPVVDDLSIHEQAAVLRRLGKLPPLGRILGTGFWTVAGRHAYTAAGSFAAFVAEHYSDAALVALYRAGGDTEAVLGVSLDAVEAEWHALLDRQVIPDEVLEAQRARFAVRSIFERPCAHRLARLYGEITRARARGEEDEVFEGLETACNLEPFEPRHRLALAEEYAAVGEVGRAVEVYAALAEDGAVPSVRRAEAYEGLALVHVGAGAFEDAKRAIEAARELPVPSAWRRRLELVHRAVTEPTLRDLVLRYLRRFDRREDGISLLAGRIAAAAAIGRTSAGRALGPYLEGRQLANAAVHDLAHDALHRAGAVFDEDPAALSADFSRALYELDAATALAAGDLDGATASLERLEALLPPTDGARRWLARWRSRIEAHRRLRTGEIRSPG